MTGFGSSAAAGAGPAVAQVGNGDGVGALIEALAPTIRPRDDWGGDLPATGPITTESDVRFLLVHHTASPNDYGPDEVIDQIRGFYRFHTGPEKGWPDVAYNFFVDRFGGIWEARAGSAAGPIRGDATGGSQGHAILCSLIGNHHVEPITDDAQASLVSLLAWLAVRYDVDPTPGTTTDFVSRGSSRWPAGVAVTARTISGHRDMSDTTCPGDAFYPLLGDVVPAAVTATVTAAAETLAPVESDEEVVLVPTESTTSITTSSTTSPSTIAGIETAAATPVANDDPVGRLAPFGAAAAGLGAVLLAGLSRLRGRAQPDAN